MTKEERQAIIEQITELEAIQADSPTKTTYSLGRTGSSIAYRMLDVIRALKALVEEKETA
jgi:hypothetical protein